MLLKLQNSPQSPSSQDEPKIKTNDQLTSNPDPGETLKSRNPRYVWGTREILNSKALPQEDIWDSCLTNPENPEETVLELSKPNRSPPP